MVVLSWSVRSGTNTEFEVQHGRAGHSLKRTGGMSSRAGNGSQLQGGVMGRFYLAFRAPEYQWDGQVSINIYHSTTESRYGHLEGSLSASLQNNKLKDASIRLSGDTSACYITKYNTYNGGRAKRSGLPSQQSPPLRSLFHEKDHFETCVSVFSPCPLGIMCFGQTECQMSVCSVA